MIDALRLNLRVHPARELTIDNDYARKDIEYCIDRLGYNRDLPARFIISESPPAHCGLGSRTQLRLAVASAIQLSLGRPIHRSELPPSVGRGGTSGIGSWGFWFGGILADGGHSRQIKASAQPSASVKLPTLAPLIYQSPFPWQVVIAIGSKMTKIHGDAEERLFAELTPVPWDETLLCFEAVYGELLPSVKERNFIQFCSAVERLRDLGFKRREIAVHGDSSTRVIRALESAGLQGVTMSSWGPAFVGFAEDEQGAERAKGHLRSHPDVLDAWSTRADATGATVRIDGEAAVPITSLSSL